jgi:hypothetical protein
VRAMCNSGSFDAVEFGVDPNPYVFTTAAIVPVTC